MNIARFSTLLLVTLTFMPIGASAHCKGKHDVEGHEQLIKPTNSALEAIWNSVFEKCPNFFEPTEVDVPGFMAPAGKKGWTIEKPGGVRVNFRGIPFPQEAFAGSLNVESAWVALSLIGDRDFQDPFPPPGTIQLSHFTIHGQTESGVTPRLACDDENFALEDFPIEPPIYLTITAKQEEG
jgi:hypothetical protein